MSRLRQIVVSMGVCVPMVIGMAGCMNEQPDPISPSAVMETSGNADLTWTASSAGKLTVFDQNTQKIAYGADLTTNQSVKVDVDNNRITLDSQVVSENSLHRGDQYKIYFEPTNSVTKTSTVETNSVETVHQP
jgi:hypothetical protein